MVPNREVCHLDGIHKAFRFKMKIIGKFFLHLLIEINT